MSDSPVPGAARDDRSRHQVDGGKSPDPGSELETWEEYEWQEWINVGFLCIYGKQDAHKLLGVRALSRRQMNLLTMAIQHWLDKQALPPGPET